MNKKLVSLVTGATLVLIGIACGGTTGSTTEHTITFRVSGAQKADVTYGFEAQQSQDLNVTVPWEKTVTYTGTLISTATLVAQNKGGGSITCEISMDGKQAKTNTSVGQYAVVTCTG